MKATFIMTALIITAISPAAAQGQRYDSSASTLAVEARLTTYLQGGYDLGLFYYPKNTRISIGTLIAGHPISGGTKELLFTSNDFDALEMRLSWIVSVQTRYHFAKHKEGFFGEIGIGWEEFQISTESTTHNNTNGFVAPATGYIWFPWQRSGFYVLPRVNGVITLFKEDEQLIDGVQYELKQFFFTPSFAIGWKF